MLKVFAGYDDRIPAGFEVFRTSVERHANEPVAVIPLVQKQLRQEGWYRRDEDERASTPFSLTRFLVPALCDFQGQAVFVDGSDMIVTRDILELIGEADDWAAVSCVQHDYQPRSGNKFLNQAQHWYPRKNWSSVMVFRCDLCTALDSDTVNLAKPSFLHRMEWADKVGALPIWWNWLAGEPEFEGVGGDADRLPALIHYTLGLPIVPGATKTEWDFKWYSERQRLVDRLLADPSLDHVKNDEPAASTG